MSKIQNPWSVDPQVFQSLQAERDKNSSYSKNEGKAPYLLVEGGKNDYEKVVSWYQIGSVPGYHIGKVEIIYNKTMTAAFEARVQLLEQRWENPAFSPKWSWEMEKEPIQKLRERTNTVLAHKTQKHQIQNRHVHLIPMFHGTKKALFDSIFRTGFDNLATTDAGFFGKGIYNTTYAEYAFRVYGADCNGQLLCNWVAFYSAYPVAHGDLDKLMGKAKYQNYDAHYALVKPKDPTNKNESIYFPIEPEENPVYDELVVFESVQTLPRYVVTLEADGISLKEVENKATKSALLTAISICIQKFEDNPEIKAILEKKLKGLQKANLTQKLSSQEFTLLRLIGILNEQNIPEASLIDELKMKLGVVLSNPQEGSGFAILNKYANTDPKKPNSDPTDPKELFELGLHFYNGIGVKQDFKSSAYYFLLAAKQGHESAALLLGIQYELGKGVEQAFDKAVKYYKLAADKGGIEAQFFYGNCHYEGKGVKQDYEIAFRYFQMAAKEENAEAQKRLGDCYLYGHEVKQDLVKAVQYYRLAADQGSFEGQYALGCCFLEGIGVEKNQDEAVNCFKEIAYQGHGMAQMQLARCYSNGAGVNQDLGKAAKYFEMAADQGIAEAQQEIAGIYEKGKGVEQNDQKAAKYLQLFADAGQRNLNAQNTFGIYCQKGKGVKQDHVMAVRYFQMAADQGYAEGQYNLGICYELGQGVKQDIDKAIAYYQKATDQQHQMARQALISLLNKLASSQQFEKAKDILQRAARLGDDSAKKTLLGQLMEKGNHFSSLKSYEKAVDFYQDAANLGDYSAKIALGETQFQIGKKYLKQEPTELFIAEEWFSKADLNRCSAAREYLGNVQCSLGKNFSKNPALIHRTIKYYQDASNKGNIEARQILNEQEYELIKLAFENSKKIGSSKFSFDTEKQPDSLDNSWVKRADEGDEYYQTKVGYFYFKKGKKYDDDDHRTAFKYFRLAAFQGSIGGICGLGRCYFRGAGTRKNEQLGFDLTNFAAERGSPDALWNLGNFYVDPEGSKLVKQNGAKAHIYFRMAADLEPKLEDALQKHLRNYYNDKHTKNMELSIKELKQVASSKKNAEALYALGKIYNYYNTRYHDAEKGQKCFKAAAKLGHEKAKSCMK